VIRQYRSSREVRSRGDHLLDKQDQAGSSPAPRTMTTKEALEATILVCDQPTINGRVYPRGLMEREVARYKAQVASGRAYGPVNSDSGRVNLKDVQFVTRDVRLEGAALKIAVEPLDSAARELVAKAIKENRVSPFGMGTVSAEGVVGDDYHLAGFSIAPPEKPDNG